MRQSLQQLPPLALTVGALVLGLFLLWGASGFALLVVQGPSAVGEGDVAGVVGVLTRLVSVPLCALFVWLAYRCLRIAGERLGVNPLIRFWFNLIQFWFNKATRGVRGWLHAQAEQAAEAKRAAEAERAKRDNH